MSDLGLEVHAKICGGGLIKQGDWAECFRCGSTFSAARMIAAIAAGQIRVDFSKLLQEKPK